MKKRIAYFTLIAAASASSLNYYFREKAQEGKIDFASSAEESSSIDAEYATAIQTILQNNLSLNGNTIYPDVTAMTNAMLSTVSQGQGATLINVTGRSAIGYLERAYRPSTGSRAEEGSPAPFAVEHAIAITEPSIAELSKSGGGVAFFGAGGTLMGVGEIIQAIEDPRFQAMLAKYPNVTVEPWGLVAHQAGSYNEKLYTLKYLTLIKDPSGYWEVLINGISQTPSVNIEFARRGYKAPYVIAGGGEVAIKEALQLLFLIENAAKENNVKVTELAAKIPIQIQIGLPPGAKNEQRVKEKGVEAGYDFLSSLYEMAKANTPFAESLANFDIKVELYKTTDGKPVKSQELQITDLKSLTEALTSANQLESVTRRADRISRLNDELLTLKEKINNDQISPTERDILAQLLASKPDSNLMTKAAYLHAVLNKYYTGKNAAGKLVVDPKTLTEQEVKERALWLRAVQFSSLNALLKKELTRMSNLNNLNPGVRASLKALGDAIQSGKPAEALRVGRKGIETKESSETPGEKAASKAKRR